MELYSCEVNLMFNEVFVNWFDDTGLVTVCFDWQETDNKLRFLTRAIYTSGRCHLRDEATKKIVEQSIIVAERMVSEMKRASLNVCL